MPGELADEVCARLGVGAPTDLDGVAALYRAWCEHVPFDTVGKALALHEGSTPPGGDPTAFLRQWLATGVGGTCWGQTAAMAAVLERSGVRCRVGIDRYLVDDEVDFHSFLVVEDGDRRWACDVDPLLGRSAPPRPGASGTHPAYTVGFDADEDGRLEHRTVRLARDGRSTRRYGVLSTDLDAGDLRAFCEVSRALGMRARNVYIRRFTATEMLDATPTDDGSALSLRRVTATGEETRLITDVEEGLAAVGYQPEVLALARRAGLVTTAADGTTRFRAREG